MRLTPPLIPPAFLRFLRLLFVLATLGSAAWLAWQAFDRWLPPQHNPFKPLDLTLEPGWATGTKLDALANDLPACFAALDRAGVEYTQINRENDQPECALTDALTLDQSLTPYSSTLSMSCPLAASLHMWERHVVIPAAKSILGERIERIETYGSWSCRRVNSAATGRWSQHASGDAVDISGVTLEGGRRIMVLDTFNAETPEGEFLRTIRDGACGFFSVTLSPDYNALHADHLHFDMGLFTICS
jgi:hypothetical protein